MICALSIQNFAFIDKLLLEFSDGFTVFSGETGAGKSIILNALGFALGKKLPIKSFKNSSLPIIVSLDIDRSKITSLHKVLEKHSIGSQSIILRRVMNPGGKTRTFINDNIASISLLEEIAPYLLEISGQHSKYSLFNEETHIQILDEYAKIDLSELSSLFFQLKSIKAELQNLLSTQTDLSDQKSYLEYAINEIRQKDPKPEEEETLRQQRKMLMSKGKLKEVLEGASGALSNNGGALSSIYSAQKSLSKFPDELSDIIEKVESISIEIEELQDNIGLYTNKFDGLSSLEETEQRLFSLKDLARKHSVSVDQLPEVLSKMEEKLKSLSNLSEKISQKKAELKLISKSYLECAEKISSKRIAASEVLKKSALQELSDIKMDKADFIIEVAKKPEERWNEAGIDDVKFLIKTNPGSDFCSIKNVASGGELSRIMLACKVAMASASQLPTIIFDEIDSGIGGAVSSSIGKKLSMLAKNMQVIAITHQPQVAAYSKNHYFVCKKHSESDTTLEVKLLSNAEKKQELARMLSGDELTDEAVAAAESLIAKTFTLS